MTDAPGRLFAFLCVLAGVWIATYWLWTPSRPKTTFDDRPSTIDRREEIRQEPSPHSGPVTHADPPTEPASAQPPATRPQPDAPRTVVDPPRFREYTVRRGDTFERIAERELGSRNLTKAVQNSNPFVSPDLLKPGTKIKIPLDPDNIQGRVVEAPAPAPTDIADQPAPGRPEAQPPVAVSPASPPGKPARRTYVVQDGDTLWGIAKKFYGKGSKYEVIFEANRALIPNKDVPPVGVEIVIPEE